MIYIRDESEPVRNGLNFYPSSSVNSRGVVIRLGKIALWLRYSKLRDQVFFTFRKRRELDFND
jgi:hypothetical protein